MMKTCALSIHEITASTAGDMLSGLLLYPGQNYARQVEFSRDALSELCPDASTSLGEFLECIRGMESVELEERYVAAFELDPSGVLYTGIHLFGEESFKRGAFMAELNARYREIGMDSGEELPDHVSVVLRYFARANKEDRGELACHVLLGTLEKMVARSGNVTLFKPLLEAVLGVIRAEFPNMVPAPFPIATEAASCAASGGGMALTEGCSSGCGMVGAGMGDRDFLTSEEEST